MGRGIDAGDQKTQWVFMDEVQEGVNVRLCVDAGKEHGGIIE